MPDEVAKTLPPRYATQQEADPVARLKLFTPLSDYYILDGETERLNKTLAHLTTTRVQYDTSGKDWDLSAIWKDLKHIIRGFLTGLPTDKAAWFDAVR